MSDIDDLAEARARLRDKGGAWRAQLLLSATKDPRPLLANALLALHAAPEWGGVLGYDEFALTAMALRPPPWVRTNGEWPQRAWSDRDDTLTAEWLQSQAKASRSAWPPWSCRQWPRRILTTQCATISRALSGMVRTG